MAPAEKDPSPAKLVPAGDAARPPMFLDLVMRKGSSETAETEELTIDLHGLSKVRRPHALHYFRLPAYNTFSVFLR